MPLFLIERDIAELLQSSAGTAAPLVWTFLLWDKKGNPLDDISLNWVSPNHAQFVRGKKVVGHIFIDAPQGAIGHDIEVDPVPGCPTTLPGAPVIAGTPGIGPQPVGRLDLLFWAGSEAGDYTTTLSLNNGNSVQMVVTAEPE